MDMNRLSDTLSVTNEQGYEYLIRYFFLSQMGREETRLTNTLTVTNDQDMTRLCDTFYVTNDQGCDKAN
jgi:hypothetical protein